MIAYGGIFLILIREIKIPPYLCDNAITWRVNYGNLYDITGCVICYNMLHSGNSISYLIWYIRCYDIDN